MEIEIVFINARQRKGHWLSDEFNYNLVWLIWLKGFNGSDMGSEKLQVVRAGYIDQYTEQLYDILTQLKQKLLTTFLSINPVSSSIRNQPFGHRFHMNNLISYLILYKVFHH